ncbi:calcium-binding protein [uncultured Roseovarius sp.]|uniref:calcium-binding protein n=1 Tax=uncultured Roseovarius sp. TaxID=293344 RepID=UPI002619E1F1|nr:calcium-binding protein [uncultured Roseovarius sp.]
MHKLIAIIGACLIVGTGPALAERDALRAYVFGNSLVHHLSDDPATNVPWWMARLAQADGRDMALSGQWGFLRDFAGQGIVPNWSFDGVRALRGAADTVVITPANFIQYQPPDAAFEGENPNDASPLSATLDVVDQATQKWPDARVMIYEGWPDMAGFGRRFPPSNRNLRRWHGYALSDYHDWFRSFVSDLQEARPDVDISLLPVSSVLSGLQTGILDELPVEALYTDNAPHGTANLYFLAALASYTALYQNPAPTDFDLPENLHPMVRDNYPRLVEEVAQAIGLRDQARAETPITGAGLADPSLGIGLNGISDWSSQHPFIDVMKTARPWIGHTSAEWGAFSTEALREGGYLNDTGWPVALPEDAKALEAFILTDQPEEATHLTGRYLLRYSGEGVLRVVGRADNVRYNYDTREIRFSVSPGDGPVALRLLETGPDDPLRDIVIVREDQLALHELGVIFNPLWTEKVADMRVIRFMDWMFTNGSPQTTWEARPVPDDATYVWRGVPVEVMIALSNRIGADPWMNMPHAADDAYMRNFAVYVRDHLDPRLRAHVEYSNEIWNFIFPQTVWARNQAEALWGDAAGDDAWMQFAGLRAAQMADIWHEVFDASQDRLSVVVGTHTGWPGLEEPLLMAPLAIEQGQLQQPPVTRFDRYGVTGYFGHELGSEDMAETVLGWITASRAVARAKASETGAEQEPHVATHGYDLAYDLAAEALRQGSLRELLQETLPYHAKIAAKHDMQLIMYEGGTHVVGHGPVVENEALTDFFVAFNYSPQMGALYKELLTGWQEAGGTLFNAFVDVAAPSKWGSWGALRHLNDTTPRWDALMQANATPPDWADTRAPGAFLQGKTLQAGDTATTLEGTDKADILLGGGGDDTLIGSGGHDRLHGGAGRDTAVLPGARNAYRIERENGRVMLEGPSGPVILVAVEVLTFTDTPGETIDLNELL